MSRGPDTDLHALIISLSQAERRYIKQDLRRHVIGAVNQSELLFDAIAAQARYDEGAIKRRYAGAAFVKRLPEAKRELLRVILRAMRQFHARRNPQRIAIAAYLDGLYLSGKGFARLAERCMEDAVAASTLTENHALRSFMKQGQITVIRSATPGIEPTSPYMEDPVVTEALQALEVAKVQALLERLQSAVQRYGQTTNAAAQAIAADLIRQGEDIQPLETVAARQLWLRMQSVHRFFFANDPEGALAFDQERLTVLEEHEHYREANLGTWLSLIHSVALRLAVLGRLEEAEPLRDTLREYWSGARTALSPGRRHNTLGQYLNLEIFLATQTLHQPVTEATVRQLVDLLDLHEATGHTEVGVAAWFNLGLVTFAQDHFRKAVQLLNTIDEYPEDLRPDTHRAATYLRILCHAEMEHDSVVTSMVRRHRRRLKGADVSAQEEIFLTCMASYLSTTPGTQRTRHLRATLKKLHEANADAKDASPVSMLAFDAWLKSKLERRPWRTVATTG